jgi:uncharacterized protein (TIGR02145 family)
MKHLRIKKTTRLNQNKNFCYNSASELINKSARLGLFVILILTTLQSLNSFAQSGVAINSTGNPANASAVLDVNSTAAPFQGLLVPRLTTANRNAISSPIESLLIYNLDTKCFEAWSSASSSWVAFGCIGCAPTVANAGTDINLMGVTSATLTGNTPTIGTGVWTVVSGTATITTPTSPTSGVTGLLVSGTATLRWTISNPPCVASVDDVVITTSPPQCGAQIWASSNLNVGTRIAQGSSQGLGDKWCYNDIEANCTTYGGLYQYTTAVQIPNTYLTSKFDTLASWMGCDPCGASGRQGICPAGYHIPTDLEWSRYEYCVENTIAPTGSTPLATFQTGNNFRGTNTAGIGSADKMKATASDTPVWNGTNSSGFSAVPAGYYSCLDLAAHNIDTYASFWVATEYNATQARYRGLDDVDHRVYRGKVVKTYGYSVRCLKN